MSQDDFTPDTPWHEMERQQERQGGFGNAPIAGLGDLRDRALYLFNCYVAYQLKKKKPPKVSRAMIKRQQEFLSISETEMIVRDFAARPEQLPAELPEGAYAIGGRSQQEAEENFNKLMNALMHRIMSNVTNTAVNLGLLDCEFDAGREAFGFSLTEIGKSYIAAEREKKKKKKK